MKQYEQTDAPALRGFFVSILVATTTLVLAMILAELLSDPGRFGYSIIFIVGLGTLMMGAPIVIVASIIGLLPVHCLNQYLNYKSLRSYVIPSMIPAPVYTWAASPTDPSVIILIGLLVGVASASTFWYVAIHKGARDAN